MDWRGGHNLENTPTSSSWRGPSHRFKSRSAIFLCKLHSSSSLRHASKLPPSCRCQNPPLQLALLTSAKLISTRPSKSASRGWSCTEDAISTALGNTYMRILIIKLNTTLCSWILDRPQSVRLDHRTSSTLILNTGVPQGCILCPLLYFLFIYDCTPAHGSNTIVKFAGDTAKTMSRPTGRKSSM